MSLKTRAIQGISWTFGQQFVTQIIQFIVQIILARVLMPEVFGLIGVLVVFMALGKSLVDSDMSSSLIRIQDVEDRDFSCVFVINITVCIFMYLILFFSSTFIAFLLSSKRFNPFSIFD